jgi:anti-anti-sigma factor
MQGVNFMTAFAPTQLIRGADQFATEWLSPSEVHITIRGDIDAYNAPDLAEYVFQRAANSRRMILDMSGVEFFSTAGFARLRTIEVRCERAGVDWTLIPSKAVLRVLTICDPRHSLPIQGV